MTSTLITPWVTRGALQPDSKETPTNTARGMNTEKK